jgi:hypothetical protein
MSSKYLLAAGALLAGAMLMPIASQANVVSPATSAQSGVDSTLVHQVHRRGPRCWVWRNECAARWGWGTWRYRRCLARHACW